MRTPRGRVAAKRAWAHMGLDAPRTDDTPQDVLFGK